MNALNSTRRDDDRQDSPLRPSSPLEHGETIVLLNGEPVEATGLCVRIRPGSVEVIAAIPLQRFEFETSLDLDLTKDEWARLTEQLVFSDEPGEL